MRKSRLCHRNLPPSSAMSTRASAPLSWWPVPPELGADPPEAPPEAGIGGAPEKGDDHGDSLEASCAAAAAAVVVARVARSEECPAAEKRGRARRPLVAAVGGSGWPPIRVSWEEEEPSRPLASTLLVGADPGEETPVEEMPSSGVAEEATAASAGRDRDNDPPLAWRALAWRAPSSRTGATIGELSACRTGSSEEDPTTGAVV